MTALQGDSAGLNGPGAIAQGNKANALGQGAVQIQGDNHAPVTVLIEQGRQPDASAATLRQAYLARLMLQLDQLPLTGGSRASEHVRLSSVYTALLTLRGTSSEILAASSTQYHVDAGNWRDDRMEPAVSVLNTEQRLVLLGGPGSGKTTFANVIALAMAGELLQADSGPRLSILKTPVPRDDDWPPLFQFWDHGALLPVQIVLRRLAAQLPPPDIPIDAQVVWRYLIGSLTAAHLEAFGPHLRTELQEHGGLVIFDGLDEVPDAMQRRMQIKHAVQEFAAAFPKARVLVTSRTYAYQKQDWKLDRFAEVQLLPFTRAQQHAFVDAWYAHMVALLRLTEPAARDRAERLKREATRNPSISELAQRPLLLTLMAQLQTEGGGELPEKREALYDRAVEMLLNQWENTKVHVHEDGTRELQPSLAEWLSASRSDIRIQLNRLAFEAHHDQPQLVGTADIAQKDLIDALLRASANPDVKVKRLEEYLRDRAGLLAAHGEGLYQFPHRSFQEYLAACHLTDDEFPEKVARLARFDTNRWREVTLLAGAKAARGSKSSAWELAEALHCADLDAETADPTAQRWGDLLAGQVLAECPNLSQTPSRKKALRGEIIEAQLGLLRCTDIPAVERALAGRSLAALGDPRPEAMTVDGMQFCWVPARVARTGSERDNSTDPSYILDIPYRYAVGRYPVTVAQWVEYVQASGDQGVHEKSALGRPNEPVAYVSQEDARRFCRWLTRRWRTVLPIGWDATLPSESEWEKAARGGEAVPQQPQPFAVREWTATAPDPVVYRHDAAAHRYSWGAEFDAERTNCAPSGIGQASAVGAFSAGSSPYGCEDMAGNLWEWTRSLANTDLIKAEFRYPYDLKDVGRNDLAPSTQVCGVIRGGAFNGAADDVHCASRNSSRADDRNDNLGFRVVLRYCSD